MTRRGAPVLVIAATLVLALALPQDAADAASKSSRIETSARTTRADATSLAKTGTGGSWSTSGNTINPDSLQCAKNKPTNETRGITSDSIKIGGLGTLTGPTVALWGDAALGAEARFVPGNANGGINGR